MRHISFDLSKIDQIQNENTFYEAIRQVRLPNGTFKTTLNNRFKELDEKFVTFLSKDKTYKIHDIGTSDGITAVNLSNLLNQHGIANDFNISDKFSDISTYKIGPIRFFADADDNILYADLWGLMFNQYLSNRFFLSKVLGKLLKKSTTTSKKKQTVLLINPRTKELIDQQKIKFSNYDLYNPQNNPGKFDIVRCMNLLNTRVFPEEMLKKGIKHIFESVNDNGYILVGRTNPKTGENYTSIFHKTNNNLTAVFKINNGSEIDHLIEKLHDTLV